MAKLGEVVKTYGVTKRSDISAILSAKMVGEKVNILKFSIEPGTMTLTITMTSLITCF